MKFGVKWRESTGRMLSLCRANKRITMVMRREVCGSVQKSSHSSIVEEWVGGGHQIRQLWYLYAFFCFSHLKTNHWVWLFCSLIVFLNWGGNKNGTGELIWLLHGRVLEEYVSLVASESVCSSGNLDRWTCCPAVTWQPKQQIVKPCCDLATWATNRSGPMWPGNRQVQSLCPADSLATRATISARAAVWSLASSQLSVHSFPLACGGQGSVHYCGRI